MIFVGFGSDGIVTASEELVDDGDRGTWMHGVASVEASRGALSRGHGLS